ncbi:Bax inhibitor-1/YccA family protein [Clostridium oryzae]|uniref:Inner membrane protein YbhL n=1 Tax=Clostridium oryzae TaxID=1450648 RepID=A0A1V4INQ1_9CLOT|nr:Bax inhibitor-1/YccA family protein [Clostridium oryzae]OPJ61678.1 inner membrane protein YbhL [Clostridium oryzae]
MENLYVKSKNRFIAKTYFTMGLGLLLTFAAALATYRLMFTNLIQIPVQTFFVAAVAEVALVWFLSARINKLSVSSARMWFFVYSILNGFTLSVVFSSYGFGRSLMAFLLSSIMFFCSAMIGVTTKKDLSTFSRVLFMGVIGLIVLGIFQMIGLLSGMNLIISLLGIVIFCGLTAYDMQNIKRFHSSVMSYDANTVNKYAIIAALQLYLDFINIFLYVLRLFDRN